jgi:hypothetical protein
VVWQIDPCSGRPVGTWDAGFHKSSVWRKSNGIWTKLNTLNAGVSWWLDSGANRGQSYDYKLCSEGCNYCSLPMQVVTPLVVDPCM